MVADLMGSIQESQPDSHTASLVQVMPEIAKRCSFCHLDHVSLQYSPLPAHCLISGVSKLGWPLKDLNPGQEERVHINVLSYSKSLNSPLTLPGV